MLRARAVEAESPPWVPLSHALAGVEDAMRHGGACARCAAWSRLLLAAPCCHLLCTDCAGLDRCVVCGPGLIRGSLSEFDLSPCNC